MGNVDKLLHFFFNKRYRDMIIFNVLSVNGFYNWMSDERYVQKKYISILGKKPNLENPTSFNEKINWLKLHYHDKKFNIMADKYEAKRMVEALNSDVAVIKNYGVYDNYDDIDFSKLPNQFVLKCTHDSGSVVICKSKDKFNYKKAKAKLSKALNKDYYMLSREWPYKGIKHRIIAEEYMDLPGGVTDYKFFCFDGKPQFLYVSSGLENHSTARISFVKLDWTFADFRRKEFRPFEELPIKPTKLNEMIQFATTISKNIPFLRVDLYQIKDTVYFSEFTFYPCGGYMRFEPDNKDDELGELIKLPMMNQSKR